MKIKKWEPDKWKHFFVAIPLGALIQFVVVYFLIGNVVIAAIVSFLVLVAICYGFELFSLITGKGHYDDMDAIAGIIGGAAAILVLLAIELL